MLRNKTFQNRDTLKQLFKYFSNDAIMAEIGSFEGSSTIVWAQKFKTVFCIDPWKGVLFRGDPEVERTYEIFRERTVMLPNVVAIRKTSKEGSFDFSDNVLDFVYIDALHDYESVKEDIAIWLPKVKDTGYIGGHDYANPQLPDVKKAVDEVLGIPQIIDTEFSWLIAKKDIK
jgi:hypothetical protein